MNFRSIITIAVAVLALGVIARPAAGQSLSLTVSSSSVPLNVTATDYNSTTGTASSMSLAATTCGIKSTSSSWTLNVSAQTSTFAFSPTAGDANPGKSCSTLAVRENGTAAWLSLATSSQVLAVGPRQNLTAPPKQLPIDYRLTSALHSDPPGNYSITVVYTVTQP